VGEEVWPAILWTCYISTNQRAKGYEYEPGQSIDDKMLNPMTKPSDHVSIKIENPLAMFASSMSSAIVLLITPIFPFIAPCRQRP